MSTVGIVQVVARSSEMSISNVEHVRPGGSMGVEGDNRTLIYIYLFYTNNPGLATNREVLGDRPTHCACTQEFFNLLLVLIGGFQHVIVADWLGIPVSLTFLNFPSLRFETPTVHSAIGVEIYHPEYVYNDERVGLLSMWWHVPPQRYPLQPSDHP
jgi:hypothetical protein